MELGDIVETIKANTNEEYKYELDDELEQSLNLKFLFLCDNIGQKYQLKRITRIRERCQILADFYDGKLLKYVKIIVK